MQKKHLVGVLNSLQKHYGITDEHYSITGPAALVLLGLRTDADMVTIHVSTNGWDMLTKSGLPNVHITAIDHNHDSGHPVAMMNVRGSVVKVNYDLIEGAVTKKLVGGFPILAVEELILSLAHHIANMVKSPAEDTDSMVKLCLFREMLEHKGCDYDFAVEHYSPVIIKGVGAATEDVIIKIGQLAVERASQAIFKKRHASKGKD